MEWEYYINSLNASVYKNFQDNFDLEATKETIIFGTELDERAKQPTISIIVKPMYDSNIGIGNVAGYCDSTIKKGSDKRFFLAISAGVNIGGKFADSTTISNRYFDLLSGKILDYYHNTNGITFWDFTTSSTPVQHCNKIKIMKNTVSYDSGMLIGTYIKVFSLTVGLRHIINFS